MDIGTKLKDARVLAGLTQEQVAEELGISRQTMSNWENGKTYPDIVSVIKMSDLYSVSLDHLLKDKAPQSDYIDYLAESTDTVKSKKYLSAFPSSKRKLRYSVHIFSAKNLTEIT